MTSNVGTKDIKNISNFGFGGDDKGDKYASLKNTVEDAMKRLFNPEFLNRIDDTIVFRNLDKEDIYKIIDIEIKDFLANIKENKLSLVLDESAKEFLVNKGFDEKFGARPLRRALQKYIEDPLAEEILRGSFKEGTVIITKHVENTEDLVFFDESLEHPDPNVEPEKSDTGGN